MAAAANSDASGSGSGEKTIALISSDNSARFEVREAAALLSQTVRHMIDEAGGADAASGDGGIPLPNVDARTLAKVLEYCNKHAPASSSSSAAEGVAPPAEDLERFDREFVLVDMDTLYSLIVAASYLKIEGLLTLTCQTVADMMKGKSPEQISKMLGISNDLTPEEKEEIRRDNAWAF